MATRLTPGARLALGARPLGSVLALTVAVGLIAAGCATRPKGPTYPPAGVTPPPAGVATDATRAAVIGALAAAGLQGTDPQQAYRPPEGAWFAAAPRTIVQVSVPNEPTPRFVAIYAFGSAADAATAAADEATYVSRGPGKVMFPNDTRFTIRVSGATAIFFAWSPGGADPRAAAIEDALDTIGTGVAIPA
ncbi:MAG TPA: hypothetical protein VGI98_01230 [Candidatus Limnocylindrales bacterium]